MKKITPTNEIYVGASKVKGAGRGVFAAKRIQKGEIIESCPVVEITEKEASLLRKTELKNYYFLWGSDLKKVALCLGFGSIYNHSYSPNATYNKRTKERLIDFVAIKDINKDEEITVNYNFGKPDDKSPLWIKSIKTP